MRARPALCALALACMAAAPAPEEQPSDQTIVFYNARIALRDDRPADVLKLWLLRNSLADLGKRPSPAHDADFESAVWAAMGETGTCPDGFDRDERGAGLWPLAMHNWVLDAGRRGPPAPTPPPFGALEIGRQQRRISLDDVLSESELRSLVFVRTGCFAAYPWLLQSAQNPVQPLRDRRVAAPLMRRLLSASLGTLDRSRVRSVAAVEARLFDLDLAILELERRHASQRGLEAQRRARMLGVSEVGASEVRAAMQRETRFDAAQGRLLRRSLEWTVGDWMSLSRSRRLFLFDRARAFAGDEATLDRLVLGLVDDRIEQKAGTELEMWIGTFGASTAERRATLVSGDRGARLLELDRATGFRERSVIALHRGVAFLEAGRMDDALRSFAFAMAHADESREADATIALARRWLSYVLSRYETTEDVIAILEALVPKQEYNAVIEDLIWRAALRADQKSFDRAVANTRRGGAFDLQVARLRTLSRGKAGEMVTELRTAAETEPSLTLRFVGKLIEHVEAEDAAVRSANAPMLEQLVRFLDPLAGGAGGKKKSAARVAEQLLGRSLSILEGLHLLDVATAGDKARTHSPARDTFAGAIRLAPADELPWPFSRPEAEAPSAFTPLLLEPVEWRNDAGALVFGWRISDAAE